MKKIVGAVLITLALAGTAYSFAVNLRTTYCCSCDVDGWRAGSGFRAINERDRLLCQCAADAGCAASYRLVPVDFLAIVLALAGAGMWLVRRRPVGSRRDTER